MLGYLWICVLLELHLHLSTKYFAAKIKDFLSNIPTMFASLFGFTRVFFLQQQVDYTKDKESGALTVSLLILLLVTLSAVGYFAYDRLFDKINMQGGNQLVNHPISIGQQTTLGMYQELNKNQKKPPKSDDDNDDERQTTDYN